MLVMATTTTTLASRSPCIPRAQCSASLSTSLRGQQQPPLPARVPARRQLLLMALTAAPALACMESPSLAADIPLFGLRKKLRKAEEQAELLVKEGFDTAEKGIVAAEKGIVAAEKGIEAAEEGVAAVERAVVEEVSFGGLAQASAVAGAEVVGVLVATSVVNGILGPEAS